MNYEVLFVYKRLYPSALVALLSVLTNNEWHVSVILFSPWEKNVVVHKVSFCFNTLNFSVWRWWERVGLAVVAVWARPSEVRTDASIQRAYPSHPTCQQRDHISCGGCLCLRERGAVGVWIMLSPDGEMPLSMSLRFQRLLSVPHMPMLTHNCMLMSLNSCPKRKKKRWR